MFSLSTDWLIPQEAIDLPSFKDMGFRKISSKTRRLRIPLHPLGGEGGHRQAMAG
jgi:hypothetical protein